MPSVRQLARDIGIATATVQRAYNELQSQGLLQAHAGRGVYVGELADRPPSLGAQRTTLLRDVLSAALAHARGLGFTPEGIVSATRELVAKTTAAYELPRIVFVGASPQFAREYGRALRAALNGMVVVETLSVADLQRKPEEVLDRLEPIRCVVSMVGTYAELREIAARRKTQLFPLVVDLTQETQEELIHLPDDVPIGLVAEEHLLPTRRALVEHYRDSSDNLITASIRNRRALRRVIDRCQVLIYAVGMKETLERAARPGMRLVELRYRFNPASLAKLRTLLDAAPRTSNSS